MKGEQEEVLEQLNQLTDHITKIVSMQQSCSKILGVPELISFDEVVVNALEINKVCTNKHGIKIYLEPSNTEPAIFDRHKIIQILLNLLSNAKYALEKEIYGCVLHLWHRKKLW